MSLFLKARQASLLLAGLVSFNLYAFDVQVTSSQADKLATIGQPHTVTLSIVYDKQTDGSETISTNLGFQIVGSSFDSGVTFGDRFGAVTVNSSDGISCSEVANTNHADIIFLRPDDTALGDLYDCTGITLTSGVAKTLTVSVTPVASSDFRLLVRGYNFRDGGGLGEAGESNDDNNTMDQFFYPVNSVISEATQSIDSAAANKIEVINLNGDSHLDLLVTFAGESAPMAYLNNGSGGFSDDPIVLPGGALNGANSIATGDIDDDDNLDILIGYPSRQTGIAPNIQTIAGGIKHYEANSNYEYSVVTGVVTVEDQNVQSLELADLAGDSNPELVIGNEGVNRIIQNTNSSLSQTDNSVRTFNKDRQTIAIHTADVLDDDRKEVLFLNQSAKTTYWRPSTSVAASVETDWPTAALWWFQPIDHIRAAHFSDYNDDNYVDLSILNNLYDGTWHRSYLGFLYSNNIGKFRVLHLFYLDDAVHDMAQMDFNNDGTADFVIAHSDGTALALLGKLADAVDEDLGQSAPSPLPEDGLLSGQALDARYLLPTDGQSVDIQNVESQSNNLASSLYLSTYPIAIRAKTNPVIEGGDLNNDGYPDLVVISPDSAGIDIYLNPLGNTNNGIASFSGSQGGKGGLSWGILLLLLTIALVGFYKFKTKE